MIDIWIVEYPEAETGEYPHHVCIYRQPFKENVMRPRLLWRLAAIVGLFDFSVLFLANGQDQTD